jgi:predicted outer membrane repeat protein
VLGKVFRRGEIAAILALCVGAIVGATSAQAASIHVTRAGDPTPNGCKPHDCSLREAVIKANSTAAGDTIKLKAKTYRLTIQGDGEDAAAKGDLDVLHALAIVGASPAQTAIKGDWATNPDRLLEVVGTGTHLGVSRLTLRNGNSGASDRGGAIEVDPNATLTGNRLRVVSNKADVTAGIDNEGTSRLSRVLFSKNQTTDCCSGFYNESGGTAKLINVSFDRNTALADTGAMYSNGIKATLQNVTFRHNVSGSFGGGALISASGTLNLTNVTFSDNRANDDGGALLTQLSSITNLNDVTFTGNVADADDDGGGDGGGLYNAGGSINVQNTILARNIDRGGEAPDCGENLGGTVFESGGHNLIGSTVGCPFLALDSDIFPVANPRLAPLAHNGGFTQTVALRRHSKAINHGSGKRPGTGGSACAKRDQRGVRRPQGPRCDIGAFEREHRRHQ